MILNEFFNLPQVFEKDMTEHMSDSDWNGEYDDEAGMAHTNLITIARAAEGLLNTIDQHEDLPEWVQEKIAKVEGMLVAAWDYLKSQEAQGIDPRIAETYANLAEGWQQARQRLELAEEFDIIERVVEGLAVHNGVAAEAIWEDLESLTDDELYVFAVTTPIMEDWQKVNKRDKTDGMSRKAVKAYRREHPGSKLKTAVTTKPSKLKKGSKASKRRKSYCSRSRGQMKMHHISCAKTPDKAICKARRRWNCESMEHSGNMVAEAGSPAQQAAIAIAMKKAHKKPQTEAVDNPGRRLIKLFRLIYRNGGDDAVDYLMTNAPIFADYYDQYEGDLRSIAVELDRSELESMVRELEKVAQIEGLMEDPETEYNTRQMFDKHDRDVEDLGIIGQGEHWAGIRRAIQRRDEKDKEQKPGVEEAFIAPALSAANAAAEYRRQGAAGGGYRGRIDIPVGSDEDYMLAGRALKKAARAAGEKIEYGLSNGVMSVFSDTMNSDKLDQFIDGVLGQGLEEMDKGSPQPGRDGRVSHKTYGSRDRYSDADPQHTAKPTKAEKMMKHAHDVMMKSMSDADKVKKGWRNPNIKEQGVAEGSLNEFAPGNSGDDDYDDDNDRSMEATFTIFSKGKAHTGTVIIFPGVTTDVEYHLNGKIYIKNDMDNVYDYDDFITDAADYIQEIIQLEGDGHHFVEQQGVAEGLNEFAPAGGGGNIPRGPKTPRRGPWDDSGEDPYQLRRYNRSIDFFDQFDSDGVDKQNYDKATGEYEGYYFDRDAASGITQIAYFKFDDPTKIGDNDPGIGWYYEPVDEGVSEGLNEFAPPGSNDGGDDGFSEETLKRLAAQWYNGDEDPRVERTLMAAGWEIGQDEGYDDEPGVFVVQAGDINGNSYISWPAHELKQGVAEGEPGDLEHELEKRDYQRRAQRDREAEYGADWDAMVSRVGKLAKAGPLKTVYDPEKRVYRNVPVKESRRDLLKRIIQS